MWSPLLAALLAPTRNLRSNLFNPVLFYQTQEHFLARSNAHFINSGDRNGS